VHGQDSWGTTFTRWLCAITGAEAAKIRAQNAKILQKPSAASVEGKAEEDRSS